MPTLSVKKETAGTYGNFFSGMAKRIDTKKSLATEIGHIPEPLLDEVLDFIKFLKAKQLHQKKQFAVLSESSLGKDWLRPEEDKAWQNL